MLSSPQSPRFRSIALLALLGTLSRADGVTPSRAWMAAISRGSTK